MLNRIGLPVLILFLFQSLQAYELSNGDFKVNLLEETGSLTFSAVNDSGEEVFLFSNANPGTSGFYVYEDDAYYPLENGRNFSEVFSEKEGGGTFAWTSEKLAVIQEYTLSESGELLVRVSVSNLSDKAVETGYKFILDCGFEEEQRFVVALNGEASILDSEWEPSREDVLSFWTSGALHNKGRAFKWLPVEPLPERIIFGNWDRLNRADSLYETVKGRDFSNPPYSINDSAVLHYYPKVLLEPGDSRNYSFSFNAIRTVSEPAELMIGFDLASTPPDEAEGEAEPVDETLPESPPQAPFSERVAEVLDTVEDLSEMIDFLSNPGMITDRNVGRLEKLSDQLEELELYENAQ